MGQVARADAYVACGVERDVDEGMFRELTAVVPGQRVDTRTDRMEGMQDCPHRWLGLAAVNAPQTCQAGLALDQRHDACGALADDGVAFPIADPVTCLDDGGAFGDAASAESLPLPARAAATLTSTLAATQPRPLNWRRSVSRCTRVDYCWS